MKRDKPSTIEQKQPNGLIRRIDFHSAFDKRNADPSKDYGIHGIEIRFLLIGPKGAVHFLIMTNWQMSHIRKDMERREYQLGEKIHTCLVRPLPADLGTHTPVPTYDGQETNDYCDVLPKGKCYYAGSAMAADGLFTVMTDKGIEAMWAELEAEYKALPDPD